MSASAKPPKERTTEIQSKLYQAAKRDPKRRFHALYDKLCLPWVLQTAWERVKENRGSHGIDGVTIEQIQATGETEFLADLAEELRQGTYRPVPVRRVEIPKEPGKTRPLGIPTIRDRVVQAAAKLMLEPIFEADMEGTPSFGFRPGLGQREALKQVADHSWKGYQWVVDADIQQFFDTLDHQRLMRSLRRRISDGAMLRLIYRWLKAGYLVDGAVHDTDTGSPQGGVLSPLLANIYLHEFDQAVEKQKAFIGRLTRFADDFVIQCGTEEHARRALAWVEEQLTRMGLRLHPEKTRLVNDQEGFDFLGFHHQRIFHPVKGRLTQGVLRWPSRKAQNRQRDKIRLLLGPPARLRHKPEECIAALQRNLDGWAHYYRNGQSSLVFRKLNLYMQERYARNMARSQPTAVGRKKRKWLWYLKRIQGWAGMPQLTMQVSEHLRKHRGKANVGWRAG